MIEVRFLRLFRDRYLLTTVAGRELTQAYYRFGPYLAWVVHRVPFLRPLARATLDAVVKEIERLTPLRRAAIRAGLARRPPDLPRAG